MEPRRLLWRMPEGDEDESPAITEAMAGKIGADPSAGSGQETLSDNPPDCATRISRLRERGIGGDQSPHSKVQQVAPPSIPHPGVLNFNSCDLSFLPLGGDFQLEDLKLSKPTKEEYDLKPLFDISL